MSLDTKQKRGSAIGLSLPFRQWLAEPDGELESGDRLALLKLCSAVLPGVIAPVSHPVPLTARRHGRLLTGRRS